MMKREEQRTRLSVDSPCLINDIVSMMVGGGKGNAVHLHSGVLVGTLLCKAP